MYYYHPDPAKEYHLRHRQVLQRARDSVLALELLAKLNEGAEVEDMMEGAFDFRQFQGRLDLGKTAIMGHSFGGATTIQALSQDQRFLCGVALDCWMVPVHRDLLETGLQQPLLFINSATFQWPENVRKMARLTRPPQHGRGSPCSILTLKGTGHTNQTDMPFVLPKLVRHWSREESTVDPCVAHKLNMDICHSFFKRYLHRDPAFCEKSVPNLDGGEGHSELIIFGSNVDVSAAPSQNGATSSGTENPAVEQNDRQRNAAGAHSESATAAKTENGVVDAVTTGSNTATDSEQPAKL
jgi:platelet-activating factor acetylhydrolase